MTITICSIAFVTHTRSPSDFFNEQALQLCMVYIFMCRQFCTYTTTVCVVFIWNRTLLSCNYKHCSLFMSCKIYICVQAILYICHHLKAYVWLFIANLRFLNLNPYTHYSLFVPCKVYICVHLIAGNSLHMSIMCYFYVQIDMSKLI